MQELFDDLRHALHMFREKPGFTATVVAAMALGIGVNTAIFSIVNAVLLKPFPYSDPDTLVAIENTTSGTPYGPWTSPAKFMYWRAQTDVFSDVVAISQIPLRLSFTGTDLPEQVTASQVSEAYFRVLEAPVVRGRPFTPAEDLPGGPRVAVISYEFWQQRLGGAEDVLGRRLSFSGDAYTVVGIVDRGFDLSGIGGYGGDSDNPDILIPFQLDPSSTDEANFFVNIARLQPDISLTEAQARIGASAAAFRQRFPAMPQQEGFSVMKAQQAFTTMYGDPRTHLWVLAGAVAFVLLIAGANVANMLLVRATGRSHEIAIRFALGAARRRIVRQLLCESVLVSLIGGVLGLGAGLVGMRALLAVNTAGLPRLGPGGSLVEMDWRVVTFTLALSVLAGVVFGLAPALVGSRRDLNAVLKSTTVRSSGSVRQNKTRSALATVEVALAVVLMIGAALLIRTSLALGRVDPGIEASNVLTMTTMLSEQRFPTMDGVRPTIRAGLERIRSMPGVTQAAATYNMPLQGAPGLPFNIAGGPLRPATGSANFASGSDGYFAAFGIPVTRGRAFSAADDAGAPAVAIINEAMARKFWADGRDPLRDSIRSGGGIPEFRGGPERRIVGIVGDVHYGRLNSESRPTLYVPLAQTSNAEYTLIRNSGVPMSWVARTGDDATVSAAQLRDAIREATGLPVVDIAPMARLVADSVSREKLNMLLMSVFGGSALLLAAIGIYGIMAFTVQQRVREIGIRMALGGDVRLIRRMVVRQGMLLAAIGIAVGLVAAFYVADVLASFLFEVEPRDVLTFVVVPVVLALVALGAVWLPARRASRVDPLAALRFE